MNTLLLLCTILVNFGKKLMGIKMPTNIASSCLYYFKQTGIRYDVLPSGTLLENGYFYVLSETNVIYDTFVTMSKYFVPSKTCLILPYMFIYYLGNALTFTFTLNDSNNERVLFYEPMYLSTVYVKKKPLQCVFTRFDSKVNKYKTSLSTIIDPKDFDHVEDFYKTVEDVKKNVVN